MKFKMIHFGARPKAPESFKIFDLSEKLMFSKYILTFFSIVSCPDRCYMGSSDSIVL